MELQYLKFQHLYRMQFTILIVIKSLLSREYSGQRYQETFVWKTKKNLTYTKCLLNIYDIVCVLLYVII